MSSCFCKNFFVEQNPCSREQLLEFFLMAPLAWYSFPAVFAVQVLFVEIDRTLTPSEKDGLFLSSVLVWDLSAYLHVLQLVPDVVQVCYNDLHWHKTHDAHHLHLNLVASSLEDFHGSDVLLEFDFAFF